jgi:GT2 family glycosyltransferase/glycosyltransferase involved in cell wall biosynthesis
MTDITPINSDAYWDTRFVENWESFDGPAQSRFFAQIAIENLPRWLVIQLKSQSLTLADWGCAQGDGTNVWANYIDVKQLTGVDFSSVAIEQAAKRYPAMRFTNENWLKKNDAQQELYDVVFSSNTLEHFHNPYDVLRDLCIRARRAVVLALPYRELNRIDEHFFSFLPENIPTVLPNGFRLTWSRVVDCRMLPNTLWSGEQIILVFVDPNWVDGLGLTLDALKIEQTPVIDVNRLNPILAERDSAVAARDSAVAERDSAVAERDSAVAARDSAVAARDSAVAARDSAVAARDSAVAERDSAVAERDSAVAERDSAVAERDSAVAERDSAVVARDSAVALAKLVQQGASWRLTRPFRFIARLARYGLTNEDRQRLTYELRQRYHRLPLPAPAKQLVSFAYNKVFGKSVRAIIQRALPASQFHAPSIKCASNADSLPDYICWGVIDWHFRHQRPQQLAVALANTGRRVFYITPNFTNDERAGFEVEALDDAGLLFQIKLFVKGAPVIYSSAPSVESIAHLRASIGEVLDWANSKQIISLVDHPFWHDIASVLPNSRLIYDCMDHHEGFGNNADSLMQLEKSLLNSADLTITTSSWLDNAVAPHARRRALIRNAGDYDHFCRAPDSVYRDPQGRRIIGYYGAIAEWFDLDLVEAVARQHPECSVLLIGADTVNARARLAKLPNVTFTGEVPYSQLPYYLYSFDVCLLPFKVIPLTLATNPVKAYEYLSARKPVVAVDLPEMAQFDGLVYAAADKDAFLAAVGRVLSQPEPDALVQQRKAFAQGQTWRHRAEALMQNAESGTNDPKVSVVVVTYNNLDFTRDCLASLDEYSQYENIEIIVVDNASSDGSPAFLSEWVVGKNNRKLILNEDNRGFAAANNQGLEIANGDYLVMLNNDTHVTPGWVRTLVCHLERDKTVGLVGPVTNNIGNEAKIDIEYNSMDEMLLKSAAFTRRHVGQTFPLRTAAFFCVMIPRTTYSRVGTLDEAFGRGFFEDDDYCRRIEQLGLRVVCAEDVFVHHHLSASFNKLKSQDRQKLFDGNKATYEAKWGEWVPHTYNNVTRK